jgi:hypothetical protein
MWPLPHLLAQFTGDRYKPEVNWSHKSWIHNAFRLYELLFWRRSGIRLEARTVRDFDGKVFRYFYTTEARLAHIETLTRNCFAQLLKVRVFVPRLVTAEGQIFFASPYVFAIALDTSTTSGASSASPITLSHTCTGSNLLLNTHTAFAVGFATGVTYNSVAATRIADKVHSTVPDYSLSSFYNAGPATGANNIVATAASGAGYLEAASYSGCAQTGIPDASTTNQNTASASMTTSVTVIAANSWAFLWQGSSSGGIAAGTGTTSRQSPQSGLMFGDSNGALSAGSNSMTITCSSGSSYAIMASFAPFVAGAGVTARRLAVLGVGQ